MFPLQGVLCASVRCGRPGEEVNKAWSQISRRCPLLLVSTMVLFVLHTANKLNKPFHADLESCALGFNQYAYEGQIQILMLLDRALHGGQVHSRESTEYFHYISTFSRIFLNKHHFLDSRAVVCCFLCCVNIQRLIPEDC